MDDSFSRRKNADIMESLNLIFDGMPVIQLLIALISAPGTDRPTVGTITYNEGA